MNQNFSLIVQNSKATLHTTDSHHKMNLKKSSGHVSNIRHIYWDCKSFGVLSEGLCASNHHTLGAGQVILFFV